MGDREKNQNIRNGGEGTKQLQLQGNSIHLERDPESRTLEENEAIWTTIRKNYVSSNKVIPK